MIDYLVRDEGNDQHAIIPAASPVDAIQGYIGVARREQPNTKVDPLDVYAYPITRKNTILQPAQIEPDDGEE